MPTSSADATAAAWSSCAGQRSAGRGTGCEHVLARHRHVLQRDRAIIAAIRQRHQAGGAAGRVARDPHQLQSIRRLRRHKVAIRAGGADDKLFFTADAIPAFEWSGRGCHLQAGEIIRLLLPGNDRHLFTANQTPEQFVAQRRVRRLLQYARREHRNCSVRLGRQRPAKPLGDYRRLGQTQTQPTGGLWHQHAQPAQFRQLPPLRSVEFSVRLRQRAHAWQVGTALDEVAYALRKQRSVAVINILGHDRFRFSTLWK